MSRSGRLSWVIPAVLLPPMAALVLGTVLDAGPSGEVRASLFPAAVALFDPFFWTCVWNSAGSAAVVALLSLLAGVSLARLTTGDRFWGRGGLTALALAPAVFSPLYGAIGLAVGPGRASATPQSLGPAWLLLCWLNTARGGALVALAVRRELALVDPIWRDAGLAAGARRWRIWRTLVWPLVRPGAIRTAAAVFGLTLFEPGVPLVLNLRRSLAFQVIDASHGAGPTPRAVVLVMAGLFLVVLAHVPGWILTRPSTPPLVAPAVRTASVRRGLAASAGLLLWCLVCWPPVVALVRSVLVQGRSGPDPAWRRLAQALADSLADPAGRDAVAASLLLGASAATLSLVLAWSAWRGPAVDGVRPRSHLPWLMGLFPGLALAAGMALLPILLRMLAGPPGAAGTGRGVPGIVGDLANWLDPYLAPLPALVLTLVVVRLPLLVPWMQGVAARWRPEHGEAAVLLGASRGRVRYGLAATLFGPQVVRAWLFTATLAATEVPAVLLLSPTSRWRPAAATVVALFDQPGLDRVAASLALLALGANALVFALSLALDDPPASGLAD
jgi:ABC-type Fe3+ transport system permease subunit